MLPPCLVTLSLDRPFSRLSGRFRSKIPTPSGPGRKVPTKTPAAPPFPFRRYRSVPRLAEESLRSFPHSPLATHHSPLATVPCCESLATVHSKRLTRTLSPLESALTSHAQLIENTATLSPLESTLTRFRAVTPLEATLTKKVGEGGRSLERYSPEWRHPLCTLFVFNRLQTAPFASPLF